MVLSARIRLTFCPDHFPKTVRPFHLRAWKHKIQRWAREPRPASPDFGGKFMSDLVAIVYPSEAKAEEVRHHLFDLRKQYLFDFSDAVIAVKTEAGPVRLNQLVSRLRAIQA
jgi:hypothetical protein